MFTRQFILEIAYNNREVFAYACEAYARILEQANRPADRHRLHADYATNWVPACDGVDRTELVDILVDAVKARNDWKRILERCGPPARPAAPENIRRETLTLARIDPDSGAPCQDRAPRPPTMISARQTLV